MSAQATALLEVEKIDIEEGFNARSHMDEEGLDQLAGSVGTDGIVQPILVRPTRGGRYSVVAGHRRLEAAKRAGVTKVPYAISQGNAHLNSLIENIHRERLDPIDTAKGLMMVKGELNLTTNKQLAKRIDKKVDWVGALLRLLNLPEAVQRYIASGQVPVEGERVLRPIAAVSPRVAECVCEVAKRNQVKGRAFVDRFDELLQAAPDVRGKDRPTMISARGFQLGTVVTDKKKCEELAERINAVDPHLRMTHPVVHLKEAEVDAARAAGCLVEHRVERRGYGATTAFITDRAFAADLTERAVERIEKEAKKRAEEEATWRARQAEARGEGQAPGQDPKARRAEAKKKAKKARGFNEVLGGNLFKGRTAARRKQLGLARAKAIAAVLIADNGELAGRGLRLTLPALQDLEVKELKSGAKRQKVSYADGEHCTAELQRRVAAARSEGEVVEILAEALVAALLADEHELAQSKRIHWHTPAASEVKKLLASDIKAARPRRTSRKGGH
jgi:ParB family chromosome partitioning protein